MKWAGSNSEHNKEWVGYNTGTVIRNFYSLTLVLLNLDIPCFTNSVDPDQLVSEEAN